MSHNHSHDAIHRFLDIFTHHQDSDSLSKLGSYGDYNGNANDNGDDNLSKTLVDTMQTLFGGIKKFPGFRTTHAKGLLVEGKFTPTKEAKDLSVAAHFNSASTPIVARFSVGGGIPNIPDANDLATPKGVAIRFQTGGDTYTDLISHSFNGFAVRTAEEFLTFLQLVIARGAAEQALALAKKNGGGGPGSPEQAALDKALANFKQFLGTHPSAATFALGPKPNPWNYGTITYYEPNTHVLTNHAGKATNVRYRLIPADGDHLYTPEEAAKQQPNYLEDDLKARFPAKPVVLTLQAHIADPSDVLDDATVPYKSTTLVTVGKIEINKVSSDNDAKQKEIAFSPVPEKGGIKGITSSKDPLIQQRKGVYWVSADQRRHDKQTQ